MDESYFPSQDPPTLPRDHWEVWSHPNLIFNFSPPTVYSRQFFSSFTIFCYLQGLFPKWTAPNMSLTIASYSTLLFYFIVLKSSVVPLAPSLPCPLRSLPNSLQPAALLIPPPHPKFSSLLFFSQLLNN